MTHWVKSDEPSPARAGFVEWYLCDDTVLLVHSRYGAVVGEVVRINEELGTYYAELCNGRGLRYFTDVNVAKDWLWAFYCLERASE
jgi:hypothetical protein